MKRLKTRLIVTVMTIWIFSIIGFLAEGAGAFFSKMSYGTCDYLTMTDSDLQKNRPIEGTIFYAELIAEGYTETTNKNTGKVESTTVNEEYYCVPMGAEGYETGETYIIVKAKVGSHFNAELESLVNLWENEVYDNDRLLNGVDFDGVLIDNEEEVVEFFEELCEESGETNIALAKYTIDCTKSVSARIKDFWAGTALLALLIAMSALFIFNAVKKKKAPQRSTVSAGYGSNYYDPTSTYGSSNSMTPQNNFQSQSVQSSNNYDPTAVYGSSNSAASQSNFQSQSGQTTNSYGTSNYGTSDYNHNSYSSQGTGYSSDQYSSNYDDNSNRGY